MGIGDSITSFVLWMMKRVAIFKDRVNGRHMERLTLIVGCTHFELRRAEKATRYSEGAGLDSRLALGGL
jgi:hypothetical protein